MILISDITLLLPMLKASIPYLQPPLSIRLEGIGKVLEGISDINTVNHSYTKQEGFCNNPEALLTALCQTCPPTYKSLFTTILNILRGINFYNTYKDVFSIFEEEIFNAQDNSSEEPATDDSSILNLLLDFLSTN